MGLFTVGALGFGLFVVWPDGESAQVTPADTESTAQMRPRSNSPPRATHAPDTAPTVEQTWDQPNNEAPSDLQALLDGQSEWAVVDAINAAVDAQDTRALHTLQGMYLPDHPGIAPAAIKAVGELAKHATEDEREQAASTLVEWYHREEHREGRDALGNRAAIVEALAELDSPTAAAQLSQWIDGNRLPLHLAVIASRGLLASGDQTGVQAVHRFDERLANLPDADGLEDALRRELFALVNDFHAGQPQ